MFTRRDFFGVVAAPLLRNITPPAIAAGVTTSNQTFASLTAGNTSADWSNRVGKPLTMQSLQEALERFEHMCPRRPLSIEPDFHVMSPAPRLFVEGM